MSTACAGQAAAALGKAVLSVGLRVVPETAAVLKDELDALLPTSFVQAGPPLPGKPLDGGRVAAMC